MLFRNPQQAPHVLLRWRHKSHRLPDCRSIGFNEVCLARTTCHCQLTPAGLVETSTNLASVRPKGAGAGWAEFAVQCSTRSSMMAPLEHYRAVIRRIAKLCGGTVEQVGAGAGVQGWGSWAGTWNGLSWASC